MKHNLRILIAILLGIFLMGGGVYAWWVFRTTSQVTDQEEISDPNPMSTEEEDPLFVTIQSPRQFAVIQQGEQIRVQLDEPEFVDVSLVVVEYEASECGDTILCDQARQGYQSSGFGNVSLSRGYVSLDSTLLNPGQYQVQLVRSGQNVATSPVFAVIEERDRFTVVSPSPNQRISSDSLRLSWNHSPNIFFVSIFLESDTDRRVIRRDVPTQGELIWDITDQNGDSIPEGAYMIAFEDSFSSEILARTPIVIE